VSNLLDAARRLNQDEPIGQFETGGRNYFVFCGRMVQQGHAPDCPWLSLPRIVAALEAAERVAETTTEPVNTIGIDLDQEYAFCGEWAERDDSGHASDCPWQALVAALKGNMVPPNDPVLTGSGP
jgi:hypothetical protein